jgi:hypothetical protein
MSALIQGLRRTHTVVAVVVATESIGPSRPAICTLSRGLSDGPSADNKTHPAAPP